MSSLFELVKDERKVCIINDLFPPYPEDFEIVRGGISEVQTQLHRELSENGIETFVISLSIHGRSPSRPGVYRVGTYVPYSKSSFRRVMYPFLEFFNPAIFLKVVRILKREDPSCVEYGAMLQGSLAPLVAALILRKKVLIRNDWLCPNLYAKEEACSDRERFRGCAGCLGINNVFLKPMVGLYSVLMLKLKRFLWNRSHGIIVQSEHHKKILSGWGINPDKMIMAPPTSTIKEDPDYDEYLKKIKNNRFVVAYVGRLTEEKGFDLLLEAFELLKERHPDLLLLVAGTGHLRREAEGVLYLGWVEKERLGSVYKAADIVAVPTTVPEIHPAVVDDAMKYKKPVVAFRVGALGEMVGDESVLLEEMSREALAEGISKVRERSLRRASAPQSARSPESR